MNKYPLEHQIFPRPETSLKRSEIISLKKAYKANKLTFWRQFWGTKYGRKICPLMHIAQLRGVKFKLNYANYPTPVTYVVYYTHIIRHAQTAVAKYFGYQNAVQYFRALSDSKERKKMQQKLQK